MERKDIAFFDKNKNDKKIFSNDELRKSEGKISCTKSLSEEQERILAGFYRR